VGWRDGVFTWVGWEGGALVWRAVHQPVGDSDALHVEGTADPEQDEAWAARCLGIAAALPAFTDPVLQRIQATLPGLRPYAAGSLFEGLVSSIAGQSISVAAAAVAQARLAGLYHDGIELNGRRFLPFPRVDQLAASEPALVRQSGVTWRRADAIVAAARAALDGQLPTEEEATRDEDAARTALRALPLVGPWTAESALLWGLGAADAHPSGDVALLRAVRLAYDRPEITLKELDVLADAWKPARAWAARLLWTNLLGPAVDERPLALRHSEAQPKNPPAKPAPANQCG
jgi:3-methyladenine DNA glycosylase/8-oxoguanine DNA glycosylase